MEREPLGGVLLIPSADLFWEFVSLAEVEDPAEAPAHLLWRLHLDQRTYLEYKPDSIVRSVENRPEQAVFRILISVQRSTSPYAIPARF